MLSQLLQGAWCELVALVLSIEIESPDCLFEFSAVLGEIAP